MSCRLRSESRHAGSKRQRTACGMCDGASRKAGMRSPGAERTQSEGGRGAEEAGARTTDSRDPAPNEPCYIGIP